MRDLPRASPSRSRARWLAPTIVAAALVFASGCRNRKRALAPVSFDPVESALLSEGDRHAAPVWTQVERALLSNGLLVQGLHEADSPELHIRVMLPLGAHASKVNALAAATLSLALRSELKRRMRGVKVRYAVQAGPGRVEISVRGQSEDAARIFRGLGLALGREPSDKTFAAHLRAQLAQSKNLSAASAAATYASARLLGLPAAHLLPLPTQDGASARKAWKLLTDPRDALLVVHAGQELEALSPYFDDLAKRWKSSTPRLRPPEQTALARLRPAPFKKPDKGHLLKAPAAPLWILEGLPVRSRPGGQIVMARRIDTSSAEARARARLAQRLLQQRVDARLVVDGPVSVLLVVGNVSESKPLNYVQRLVEEVESLSNEPIAPGRLAQAARLWLGARVVRASLDEEDWTSLWSEALDLCVDDKLVGAALALDAKIMLETSPAQLQEFAQRWMRPRDDQGGWVWALAGASPKTVATLGESLSLKHVDFDAD